MQRAIQVFGIGVGIAAIVAGASAQSSLRYPGGRADVIRAPAADTRPLGLPEQKLVRDAVSETLLDPTTPLFKLGPQIITSQRYCGLVNGKNAFGGYTGYLTFSVIITRDASGRIRSASDPQVYSTRSEAAIGAYIRCVEDGYAVAIN